MLSEKEIFREINAKHKKILIDPENLDSYLSNFDKEKKDLFDPKKLEGSRVLITGITGFVGSHLAEKLVGLDSDIDVYGVVRRQSVPNFPNIKHIVNDINLIEANLIDYSSLEHTINNVEPDYIFHLAAQSFVPTSFIAPIESVIINIQGTVNLLEILRKSEINFSGIQVACSSEQYGLVYPDEVPINENNPFRPQSPYAVSKIATEKYSLTYHRAYGLPIVITRGFNHTGPRRGIKFVTSVIASQIANIIKGKGNKIIIGNPKPIRDFTFIEDMIQGYILSIIKGKRGEVYNLGHGFGISIENLIKLTASIYDVSYEIVIDKSRYRPAEVNILVCDYSKAKKELGYYPQYSLVETIRKIVEFYLEKK